MKNMGKWLHSRALAFAVLFNGTLLMFSQNSSAQAGVWATHAHDAQHSAVSSVAAQPFGKIDWHVPVDVMARPW
jgi:hypothetical protein